MNGAKFRSIRSDLGFTVDGIAGVLEVDPRTIYRWEANERAIPGPAKLLMLVATEYPQVVSSLTEES